MANFSREDVTVALEGWADAELLLCNYPTGCSPTTLRAWEACVFRRR
jgi:hypothetical protein